MAHRFLVLVAVDRIGAMELNAVENDGGAAVEVQEGRESTAIVGGFQAEVGQGSEAVGVSSVD